jgi:restriction endonuclease S subunit
MSDLIGATPSTWATTRLSDICTLIPGASTPSDLAGAVPVLKPRNISAGKLAGPVDRISAEEAARRPRYQVRSGDILCVRTGSVGRVGLVAAEQGGWIFGTGLICLRPAEHVDPQFLCFYLTHPAVTDWVARQARGTTAISSISAQVLGALPVSLPPLATQRAIGRALATLNDKIEAHQRICQTTTELRDALLPLLFSGELPPSLRKREEQRLGALIGPYAPTPRSASPASRVRRLEIQLRRYGSTAALSKRRRHASKVVP